MQTMLLVRALIELGQHVTVCSYFENDERVVEEFQASGAIVQLLGWSRSINAIKFIQALSIIILKQSPAAVHIQYMAPGLLPILAARLTRVSAILATVHQPGTPHGLKAHFLLRLGARLTDRFTCVSEAAEKSWFGNARLLDPTRPELTAGRRHLTIPNAVDINLIDHVLATRPPVATRTTAEMTGKLVVGTVARLSSEKGIDVLIRAFAEVHRNIPGTHLLIVGDGMQMADLQQLARDLDVVNAITWAGRLSWEEAIGCMGIMNVVAVPSRFEGFGLTAVEAMACGKPVVASSVDGLSEVVRDGVTGFLTPSSDASALAGALIKLLEKEDLRKKLGCSARKHAKEHFAYPIFRERCRVLYDSLTPRGNFA